MRITFAAGALTLVASVVWAAYPVRSSIDTSEMTVETRSPETAVERHVAAVDSHALQRVRLWNPLPLPATAQAEPAPEPPKPLRAQLIGIIEERGQLHAALYDPDEDRIVIVKEGESVKTLTVMAIKPRSVELFDGQSRHELRLKETDS